MAKTLKQATQRPKNIGARVPDPPPQQVPYVAPQQTSSLNKASLGPAPALWTNPESSVRQWYRPGTSQTQYPTLPSKVNPQLNAQAKSVYTGASGASIAQLAQQQKDIAALQAQGFQGTWSSTVSYFVGALVDFGGVVYVAILGGGNTQNLNQEPDTATTYWQATGQVQFFGAWDSGTTYGVGALVDFGGVIYVSIQASNLNNEPDTSPLWWTKTGTESFAGAWSSATAYTTGQTVTDSGSLYIALQNSTNENPTSTTGYWQLLTGNTIFYGAWSNTQAYPIGAEVSYNGSFWLATAANTNQTPAPGSSYWENTGTAGILLAAWSSSIAYLVGMEVTYSGNVYQSILNGTNHQPDTSPTYWALVGPGSVFYGNWSNSQTYGVGALVDSGGIIYVSIQAGNLNNTPASSPTWWSPTGTENYAGPWSSATAYTTGVTVTDAGGLYIALQNSTNQDPTSTTGYWQLITGSTIFYGNWSNTQAYPVGAQVFYNGAFWLATAANTNQTPAPGSSYWENVGTSAILLTAWSSSVAYQVGMEVTYLGFVFQSIQAGTNQTPPTPPATSAFWENLGPASIDPSTSYVLAKGSTPLTQNTGLSYTSTTTSIDLIWSSLALYRADGAITTIGSSSQNVTSLGSGRTYFAYPTYDEATATFKFISNSDVSFPTLKGIAYTNAGNEYATTTTSAALPAAFSISFWVQVASGYAGGGGLNINTSHTTLPLSSVNSTFSTSWSSGTIQVGYRDSGGTFHTLASTQTYNDGEFHHVCYTCSPSAVQQFLYVDGVQVASGTVATAVSATSGFFWLNRDSGNITMTGTLTEIAFFNTALTAANVAAIYNAGNSISQTALETVISSLAPTIWWKSTDAGPTSIADSGSIGGNTGTAVNSPTFATTSAVFGAIGSPAILWPSRSLLVSQVQAMQGNVPFTQGGWAVATTSGGTGGGTNSGSSGGSGTGCYSGNTKVQTPNGPIAISKLQAGDFVISHGGVARRVLAVLRHEADLRTMIDMGGELVTPNHIVADGKEWTVAGELFKNNPKVKFGGEVFNLTVAGDSFEEHSYLLASGVLSHNAKFS